MSYANDQRNSATEISPTIPIIHTCIHTASTRGVSVSGGAQVRNACAQSDYDSSSKTCNTQQLLYCVLLHTVTAIVHRIRYAGNAESASSEKRPVIGQAVVVPSFNSAKTI